MTTSQLTDKGGRAEELLRSYFLRNGFFVARGVTVIFQGTEVTDIDLWLYLRASTINRIRVNVDAKNRSTPKALERILWAKGLQASLGFDQCIVATTDKRSLAKQYGKEKGVLVLDGEFLSRLEKSGLGNDRLTEEEFVDLILSQKLDKLAGNWRGRLREAKARLVNKLEFDGCNSWLEDARYFIEQSMVSDRQQEACRLLYLILAFFLIGLDHSSRTFVLEDGEARKKELLDGFLYGSKGKARTEELLHVASGLIGSYAPELLAKGEKIKRTVLQDLGDLPADILSEYFSRKEVSTDLFSMARALEEQAYSKTFIPPGQLPGGLQGLIGVTLDFFKIDRKRFFEKSLAVQLDLTKG